ncbi:hypothetical protein CRENPOLYSF1_610024 [Crenothrix polyspora]|uniref:Uncharacterized protein n=1 Tax=Crenothrix polyspora TaxID=360316 RepID=A0A1R4HFF6_9GAMM|nr:hypothetical protein CRENPOLYSF1_610024 [Crenothrix polyspora]
MLIHAPLTPNDNKTKGPTQHSDAAIPANKPPINGRLNFPDTIRSAEFLMVLGSVTPVPSYRVKAFLFF